MKASLIRLRSDRTAFSCEDANFLQREMGERLLERLDYIRLQPKRILEIGVGTGWMGKRIRSLYAETELWGLDFSVARLTQAKKQGYWVVGADAHEIPFPNQSIDLVLMNDVLHWLADTSQVLAECHRVLRLGGLLMLSTLGPDSLKELRKAYETVYRPASVHTFLDMHDLGDLLLGRGFSDPVVDREDLSVVYSSERQLLKDIRNLGANYAGSASQGLMTPKRWQQLWAAYPRVDGHLSVNLECIQAHAWRLSASITGQRESGGESVIALQQLRASLLNRQS